MIKKISHEDEYTREYFDREDGQLIQFLGSRGLNQGISGNASPLAKLRFQERRDEALNDYAIWVNARDRKLTVFEAIRNIITRRSRFEAHQREYPDHVINFEDRD